VKTDPALIRDIFDYRPDGMLVWKINTGKKRLIGTIAGSSREPDGYQRVGLYGRDYYLHHLVWAWHHGSWPAKRLDHQRGNPANNPIENLREASQSQNLANSKARKRDYPKGVSPVRGASTYNARITVNYTQINLGNYRSEALAHAAYLDAARRYFGDFARAA
jgi:hypothetical protein